MNLRKKRSRPSFLWLAGTVVGLALSCAPAAIAAGDDPGAGDAGHFVRSGIGARAIGMGRAFTCLADGIAAGYWNPAALVQSPSLQVGGLYENRYGGLVELQYLGASWSSRSWGTALLLAQSDLFKLGLLSAAVGFPGTSLGASARVYWFPVPGQPASGVGLDLGALHSFEIGASTLLVGAATSDVGWTRIRWDIPGPPVTDSAAWVARLGLALSTPQESRWWRLAADLESALRRPPRSGESSYFQTALAVSGHVGAEYQVGPLSLRGGLSDLHLFGEGGHLPLPSLGVGMKASWGSFDLAWAAGTLGPTFVLSGEFSL